MLFVILAPLCFILIVGILKLNYLKDVKYFESRGIVYLGNNLFSLLLTIFTRKQLTEIVLAQYEMMKGKNLKIAGIKDFGTKSFIITDLDLVKQILVKDFDHFVDRKDFQLTETDFLSSKMILFSRGERWKCLRSKISPTFTTGKIRRMFQLFHRSGKDLVKYFEQEVNSLENLEEGIYLSKGFSKFTMDVIASTGFGVEGNCFDQRGLSLFEEMALKLQIEFGPLEVMKILLKLGIPKLGDLLEMKIFNEEAADFFTKVIKGTIERRVTSGEKREDFIQLMLEARQGKGEKSDQEEGILQQGFETDAELKIKEEGRNQVVLDDDTIVANSVLFILGGFESVQSLLHFSSYALALNPEVQERLRKEVRIMLERNGGEFNYDGVNQLEYLDAFIMETMRYYPAVIATDRGCTHDYKVPGMDLVIRKGEGVSIPIYGIHHDEEYYKEPWNFNPDRFLPQNRDKLNPYAFLGFGHGPRNCLASRFALTEVKLVIGQLVNRFYIEPCKNTLIPMKFSNSGTLKPHGGMWLSLRSRFQ